MQTTTPGADLAHEIERLSHDGLHRPDEWLRFLAMDVLAGFGKHLEEPWSEYHHERLFGIALLYAKRVLESPRSDILGSAYMELSSHGHRQWMGQFFTPECIADLAAEMTFAGTERLLEKDGSELIRVMEPAAGAGAMLLATCKAVDGHCGADVLRRFSFTAIDLDGLCAHMAAAQLLANAHIHAALGEVLVYHGNALTDERFQTVIHATALPLGDEQPPAVVPAEDPRRIEAVREAATSHFGEQLSLFV